MAADSKKEIWETPTVEYHVAELRGLGMAGTCSMCSATATSSCGQGQCSSGTSSSS